MKTLTIHFAHPHIEPVVIEDCEPEFEDGSGTYELPSGTTCQDEVIEAMVGQSEGLLRVKWFDEIDGCAMYDVATSRFAIWKGDGDNKGRGFRLDPEFPLPYIERIEVS